MRRRLLLLAGTAEARQIAAALAGADVEVVASLAGATRAPRPLGVATRVGGFGGRDGFADYLVRARTGAVLDATHPFAAAISHRSAAVCGETGIPYAQLLRPSWRPEPGDDWVWLAAEAEAARHIAPGATVFLATGGQSLHRFAGLCGCRIHARRIESAPEPFPFPCGGWVTGRPPFAVAEERALFARLGIDWLVARDAGGAGGRSKLDAARGLGIRVAMIRRPPQPAWLRLETVAAALDWVAGLG